MYNVHIYNVVNVHVHTMYMHTCTSYIHTCTCIYTCTLGMGEYENTCQ